MGFVLYNGEHSINFIIDGATVNTWEYLHLIPVSRPSIAIPEPRVNIIQLPMHKTDVEIYKEGLFFDATDYLGPLTFGNRTGEWNFVIDHEKWSSWDEALRYISELLNGVKVSVQLTDDTSRIYEGYLTVSGYSSDGAYSSIVIKYDLNAKHSKSNTPFYYIRFLDNDGSLIQASYVERNSLPVCKTIPKKERKQFSHWNPSIYYATGDADYTAVYQNIVYYRITFKNYDGTVIKSYDVKSGEYPFCETKPTRNGYIFLYWSPTIVPATNNAIYTATFIKEFRKLSDTWQQVNSNILDGSYRSKYMVGDMVPLNISGYYDDYAQIVAIDTDVDANDRTIPITWILSKACPQLRDYGVIDNNVDFYYGFPQIVRNMMASAKKYSFEQFGNASSFTTDVIWELNQLWSPSYREIFGGTEYENQGVTYTSIFANSELRKKMIDGENSNFSTWWLRTFSKNNYSSYLIVDSNGNCVLNSNEYNNTHHVVLGFCTKGYSG